MSETVELLNGDEWKNKRTHRAVGLMDEDGDEDEDGDADGREEKRKR